MQTRDDLDHWDFPQDLGYDRRTDVDYINYNSIKLINLLSHLKPYRALSSCKLETEP